MAEHSADLVVVGAGPKAAAIAAKAHVLNGLGFGPISVCIVERREVAASWTGRHGFTTGGELLATRPEKDVGFPYQSAGRFGAAGPAIDAEMARFSWQSYLIHIGEYRRWVDAGAPCPIHREFAAYVSWVLSRATDGVELRIVRVAEVRLRPGGWHIRCERESGVSEELIARHGIVLTGPGAPRTLPVALDVADRVLYPAMSTADLRAFWLPPTGKVCIVGSGESAASFALYLIQRFGSDLDVTFVAPSLPYARAESFLENAVYSDPDLVVWERLTDAQRREFFRRTERGVLSSLALSQLSRHRKLTFVVGRVRKIAQGRNGLVHLVTDQPEEVVRHEFDAVAVCVGSCPLTGLLRLLGDGRVAIEERLGFSLDEETVVARHLDSAFALRGLSPRIHLPALAGFAYGPGFPNLGCLGRLSDHVLSAYVSGERPEELKPASVRREHALL